MTRFNWIVIWIVTRTTNILYTLRWYIILISTLENIFLISGNNYDKIIEIFCKTVHLHRICSVRFTIHTANLLPSPYIHTIHGTIAVAAATDRVCLHLFPMDRTFNTPSDFTIHRNLIHTIMCACLCVCVCSAYRHKWRTTTDL